MGRKFKVGHSKDNKTGIVLEFFVTDAHDKGEIDVRPKPAVFPVSQRYYEELQERRAQDYRDYLNKLEEAADEAYEQNKLINILKA